MLFLCATLVGSILLSFAIVIWLSQALGSLPAAMLLIGVVWIVAAAVVYALKLHATVVSIRRQLATIYDVSAMFEALYRKILLFIKNVVGSL